MARADLVRSPASVAKELPVPDLSVVVPILAADLAVAGIVPATTIPTAIALAGALVAVVALLALLPSLKRPAV